MDTNTIVENAKGSAMFCPKTFNELLGTATRNGARYHLMNGDSITLISGYNTCDGTRVISGTDVYGKEVFINLVNVAWFECVTINVTRWKSVGSDGTESIHYTTYVLSADEEMVSGDDRAETYRPPLVETVYIVLDDGTEKFLKRIVIK